MAQRRGDKIAIPGDYQARALREGPAVQRFWHRAKLDLVERRLPVAGMRVLDVGCGSGVVAEMLASSAAHVDAVDANPEAISYCRSVSRRKNVSYHEGFVENLTFNPSSFDRIVCLELIEHLYPEQGVELLRELKRLLRPGGLLLLSTPNYASAWPLLELLMDRLRLAPRMHGDQHVSRYTRRRLVILGERAGLESVATGRFCGLAPFLAPISSRLASLVDRTERAVRSPLGLLLFALWKPRLSAHSTAGDDSC